MVHIWSFLKFKILIKVLCDHFVWSNISSDNNNTDYQEWLGKAFEEETKFYISIEFGRKGTDK